MISDRDLVRIHFQDSPYVNAALPRRDGEAWLEKYERWPKKLYGAGAELLAVPSCRCCGDPAAMNLRCSKHQDRNPCAVEGCKRTTDARRWLGDDRWLCVEHWRLAVSPHSARRRALRRLWRLGRQLNWPEPIRIREERIWRRVVARARARAAGDIDEAEIRRMFGWDIAA